MKPIFAITYATVYGLIIRFIFGFVGDLMGIMSLSFLVVGPLLIGFLTVILQPKRKALGNRAAFFMPWVTSLIVLVITVAFNIEGVICWIMIYPLFAILAGVGGLIANKFRKPKIDVSDRENYDYWTKPDKLGSSLVLLIPMFLGIIEGQRTLTRKDIVIKKQIIIAANPPIIWKVIGSINDLKDKGKTISLFSFLGFPSHLKTTTDTMAVGGKRIAYYEKGLYFDETITKYENEKLMVLDIKTDPTKIPPSVMDEHILIGGKYLDILQDEYKLETLPNGNCLLTLSSHFFINTPFNWYATIWADFLMSDILTEELNLINAKATGFNDQQAGK